MPLAAPIALPPALEFDEPSHVYRLNGNALPSVTGVLSRVGAIDPTWFNDDARRRGSAVHDAVHKHESGQDWYSALPECAAPYLAAWWKFKNENNHTTLQTEIRLCHPTEGWAGTLDSLSMLNELLLIMDLKTSASISLWMWLQVFAYLHLVRVNSFWLPFNAADLLRAQVRVLQLKPDGNYKLLSQPPELNEKRALDLFYSALKLSNFMKGR